MKRWPTEPVQPRTPGDVSHPIEQEARVVVHTTILRGNHFAIVTWMFCGVELSWRAEASGALLRTIIWRATADSMHIAWQFTTTCRKSIKIVYLFHQRLAIFGARVEHRNSLVPRLEL